MGGRTTSARPTNLRRIVGASTSALLLLGGLVVLPPRAYAVGAQATMRQLAGAIPYPYKEAAAVTRVGEDLFVLDRHAVERVDLSQSSAFSFFAGQRDTAGSNDGTSGNARFNSPRGLTGDGTYLYVADTNNHTIRRVVITTGEVTTLAGAPGQPGDIDGTGGAARFKKPLGLTLQGGYLWVTDSAKTVRKMELATGTVTTVAGSAGRIGTADGIGTAARFLGPRAITTNGRKIWVADGDRVRTLNPESAQVTTLARVEPQLKLTGITFTGGKLYAVHPRFSDVNTTIPSQVRRVDPVTGQVVTFGFTSDFFTKPGITSDANSVFVGEGFRVTQRDLDPRFLHEAGGIGESGTADGIAGAARFRDPTGVTSDGNALYVADPTKDAIRKVVIATGEVSTLATGILNPLGLTNDGTYVYVSQGKQILRVVIATGETTELAVVGSHVRSRVNDIVSDANMLYVANDDCAVYAVEKDTGSVRVIAGAPGSCGTVDGTGADALLGVLAGITLHGGDLYVTNHSSIRRIVIATGQVTTVVSGGFQLSGLTGITSDGSHLYAVQRRDFNSSIRRVDPASGELSTVSIDTNPIPLTYIPTLASATKFALGYSIYGIVADQGRLFFTNVRGVGVISDP